MLRTTRVTTMVLKAVTVTDMHTPHLPLLLLYPCLVRLRIIIMQTVDYASTDIVISSFRSKRHVV